MKTAHRVRHPGVDFRGQELLVKPLAERGLVAGKNIFVAFALERMDPGVEDHSPDATLRVLGGVTQDGFIDRWNITASRTTHHDEHR